MAATQVGTTLKISFGAFSYTGYVPQDCTVKKDDNNVEVIRDADGATFTKILMDPFKEVQFTCVILGATGSIEPPAKGSTVTMTPPEGTSTAFYVEAASVASSPGAARLSLTLHKETSMTYT